MDEKIRFLITAWIEVECELKHFPGASNVQEAAEMQQRWFDDGECSIADLLGDDFELSVVPAPRE